MEGTGEISDTDSGIILHSGSDSPTTHTKDVTTHTRAMKVKHQALQDQLESCLLQLKKLCIREAELTGQLPKDYPLLSGEKPPQIRRRIGAAFKLDEQNILEGSKDSELSLADAELALQMKIYEAARKLCEEHHLSKAVRKSRLQQCKVEEKKLKKLQEMTFQLRLERGRSSPLPAFNISKDLGTSDDSSLSDSVVQDEEVTSQSSQPSSYPVETDPPLMSTHSSEDGSYMSHSVAPRLSPLNSCQSPCPSLDSNLSFNSSCAYDQPPIQNSPWTESSLDQPYQKSKKSHTSSNMSRSDKSERLPQLEACPSQTSLPQQLSHLRLGHSHSNSTPSTPEKHIYRQLSLRLSSPESSALKDRGRTRVPRRRPTESGIILPDSLSPTKNFLHHEDSNSEKSFSSYGSSPCQEFPSNFSRHYLSPFPLSSPQGSYGPPAPPSTSFYHPQSYLLSPRMQRTYYNTDMVYPPNQDLARSRFHQHVPNRYDYCYRDAAVPHQRAPSIRVTPPAQKDQLYYHANGHPHQVVNEQLKSWHQRSQLKAPRSRSLDRPGAVRMKTTAARELTYHQNHKYQDQGIQRGSFQRPAEDVQEPWFIDDSSHYMSQV
ncbi:innate immunity activator b [Nothobranchius furzeri]|uniref:Chromosome 1 open reading frame 106 n=3 Tax=Nothobranchius TaxID=28779 RepID=A0A1A8A9Y8_NOTFU|nr:transcript variant X2 [Nothobranchius furzeri]KAF7208566.1 transcript variant X1 [Nothobranchius furzeri]